MDSKITIRDKHYAQRGAALIEFAIVLPILLALIFAIIDFGYGFVVYEGGGRVVSSVNQRISNTPIALQSQITQDAANNMGSPLVTFGGANGNNICAQAYCKADDAESGLCSPGTWSISMPASCTVGQPYYVAIKAQFKPPALVPVAWDWLAGATFVQTAIATVSPGLSNQKSWINYGGYHVGARQTNVVYTNSYSSDMEVAVSIRGGVSNSGCSIFSGNDCSSSGVNNPNCMLVASCGDGGSNVHCFVSATVPAGSQYTVWDEFGNACQFTEWAEMTPAQ